VKLGVLGEIHLAHPAGPERGENFVMPERLADQFIPIVARRPVRRYPGGDFRECRLPLVVGSN
jgi:hypothetical protein